MHLLHTRCTVQLVDLPGLALVCLILYLDQEATEHKSKQQVAVS